MYVGHFNEDGRIWKQIEQKRVINMESQVSHVFLFPLLIDLCFIIAQPTSDYLIACV